MDYGDAKTAGVAVTVTQRFCTSLFEFVIIMRPLAQSMHYAIHKSDLLFPLLYLYMCAFRNRAELSF